MLSMRSELWGSAMSGRTLSADLSQDEKFISLAEAGGVRTAHEMLGYYKSKGLNEVDMMISRFVRSYKYTNYIWNLARCKNPDLYWSLVSPVFREDGDSEATVPPATIAGWSSPRLLILLDQNGFSNQKPDVLKKAIADSNYADDFVCNLAREILKLGVPPELVFELVLKKHRMSDEANPKAHARISNILRNNCQEYVEKALKSDAKGGWRDLLNT